MTQTDGQVFLERLRVFEGRVVAPPESAADEVNQAMIRHWCEAIGDDNAVYTDPEMAAKSVHGGVVAPPAMLQAWTMAGVRRRRREPTAQEQLLAVLDTAGFTSVVATNCEQEYHRYLRPGDRVSVTSTIESVSEEKATGLGAGHFITTRHSFTDEDGEVVGTMSFRILKFRPLARAAEAKPGRPRPAVTHDNAFFFEGTKRHCLLIQRCLSCGLLRHPPGPGCSACQSLDWDTVEASGGGSVHSYVVVHHPQVPAFDYPLVVALVDLDEGTRFVANLVGVDPGRVEVGMRVGVEFVEVDGDLTLPQFRPAPAVEGG